MVIIRISEIREMEHEEQELRLRELQVELSKLRAMVQAGGALENPSRVKELRKTIARIKTVQNEMKKGDT